jgi:hypothetical protein
MKKSLYCLLIPLALATGCAGPGDALGALPRIGETVTLADEDGGVFVYRDRGSQARGVAAAVAQDEAGMAALLGAGALYEVPRGTRARVLDLAAPGAAEVRLLDGAHAGEAAWCAVEPLHRE